MLVIQLWIYLNDHGLFIVGSGLFIVASVYLYIFLKISTLSSYFNIEKLQVWSLNFYSAII